MLLLHVMTGTTVFFDAIIIHIHPTRDRTFQIAFKYHLIFMLLTSNGLPFRNQPNGNCDVEIQQECTMNAQSKIQIIMNCTTRITFGRFEKGKNES